MGFSFTHIFSLFDLLFCFTSLQRYPTDPAAHTIRFCDVNYCFRRPFWSSQYSWESTDGSKIQPHDSKIIVKFHSSVFRPSNEIWSTYYMLGTVLCGKNIKKYRIHGSDDAEV